MSGRVIHKRVLYFIATALFITTVILVSSSISGLANTWSVRNSVHYKYYASIAVEDGDSLWEIATRYMRSEYMASEYKNIEAYINEIRSLNNLKSDMIHAGEYLMIPYYSKEIL